MRSFKLGWQAITEVRDAQLGGLEWALQWRPVLAWRHCPDPAADIQSDRRRIKASFVLRSDVGYHHRLS